MGPVLTWVRAYGSVHMGLGIWAWAYGSSHMGPGIWVCPMSNLIFMCLVLWDPRPKTQDPNPKTQDPDCRTQDPNPKTQIPANVYAPTEALMSSKYVSNLRKALVRVYISII